MAKVVNLAEFRTRSQGLATLAVSGGGALPVTHGTASEATEAAPAPPAGRWQAIGLNSLADLRDERIPRAQRHLMLSLLSEQVRRSAGVSASATPPGEPWGTSDVEWLVNDVGGEWDWTPVETQVRGDWVLVVEDDLDARDELCEALTRQGFMVWLDASTGEALESLDSGEQFSTVIVDARLSDGSAHPLIAALARQPERSERLVLISGLTDPRLAVPECLVDRTLFLEKPLRLDELLAALPERRG